MKIRGAIRALGAVSRVDPADGTPGICAGALVTDGETISELGDGAWRAFDESEAREISTIAGLWPDAGKDEARRIEAAAEVIETGHAVLLTPFAGEASLIGLLGHLSSEAPGRELRLGDGQILAEILDRPVAWDMVAPQIEMGGQGGGVDAAFHHALARYIRAEAPVAFVACGGAMRVTWVDPAKARAEDPGALVALEAGPGIVPPEGAGVAGDVDADFVSRFLREGYLMRPAPKRLGAAFDWFTESLAELATAAQRPTALACLGEAMAQALVQMPERPARLWLTGPARKDPGLAAALTERCGIEAVPIEAAGVTGDWLAAQAVGHAAVRLARGLPTAFPGTAGTAAAMGGGVISTPGMGAA